MGWKKRKRYRISSIVSFLCTFCFVTFIVGNIIMLREGFVQLYSSLGGKPLDYNRDPQDYHLDVQAIQGHLDVRIDLPVSALAAETRLRKLMENDGVNSSGTMRGQNVHVNIDSGFSSAQTNTVVSMTSEDIRRMLTATSECHLINITNKRVLGSGFTKVVYQGYFKGHPVAIKTVDVTGNDVVTCLKQGGRQLSQCYDRAASKILKETVLLKGLQHPNIVKVLGYCVPEKAYNGEPDTRISMVTEIGQSIDVIKLLQMSWEDRLRISYGLTKLLHYLANSPYGSVLLTDFQRQQFVVTDGDIRLTDIDDMQFSEPTCDKDSDCTVYYSSTNITLSGIACNEGVCQGMNERKNIFNAAVHFITFLLPIGVPPSLKPALTSLVTAYGNASLPMVQLLGNMEKIVHAYSSGEYLQRSPGQRQSKYLLTPASDLPGQYDYRCRYTIASSGCTVSVFDLREAEDLCDGDTLCQGFILSDKTTWTGRLIVHLKSGVGPPSPNPQTNLYVKPTAAS